MRLRLGGLPSSVERRRLPKMVWLLPQMIDLPPRMLISGLTSSVRLVRNACLHAFRDIEFSGSLLHQKKQVRPKAYAN